ncbi:hypothetical protein GEMRC1_006610 [Eukaryota sp. GEM-RC1]
MQVSITKLSHLVLKTNDKRSPSVTYLDNLLSSCFTENDFVALINSISVFSSSTDLSHRRSSVVALGYVASKLPLDDKVNISSILELILIPLFSRVLDLDSHVRLLSFEALYSLCKALTHHILSFFHLIFKSLVAGFSDPSTEIVASCLSLERLLQDILLSHGHMLVLDPLIPCICNALSLSVLPPKSLAIRLLSFLLDCLSVDLLPYTHILLSVVIPLLVSQPLPYTSGSPASPRDAQVFAYTFADHVLSNEEITLQSEDFLSKLRSFVNNSIPLDEDVPLEFDDAVASDLDPLSRIVEKDKFSIVAYTSCEIDNIHWEDLIHTLTKLSALHATSTPILHECLLWFSVCAQVYVKFGSSPATTPILHKLSSIISFVFNLFSTNIFSDLSDFVQPLVNDIIDVLTYAPSHKIQFKLLVSTLSSFLPQSSSSSTVDSVVFSKYSLVCNILKFIISKHWFTCKNDLSPNVLCRIVRCLILCSRFESNSDLQSIVIEVFCLIFSQAQEHDEVIFKSVVVTEASRGLTDSCMTPSVCSFFLTFYHVSKGSNLISISVRLCYPLLVRSQVFLPENQKTSLLKHFLVYCCLYSRALDSTIYDCEFKTEDLLIIKA